MAQLVILTVLGFKNLKRRLFAPLRRGILAALLLCTVWAAQAQNLTVSINGGTALTNKASLQAAIEGSGLELSAITSLEISAGNFTTEDWNYLLSNKTNLRLKSFIITDGISSVADMPDTDKKSYFYGYGSVCSVSIDAEFVVGKCAFYNCQNLSSISLPKVTTIGDEAFYGCHLLTKISLPAVTSIGDYAFMYCTRLTFLELGATPPTVKYSFVNCYSPRFLWFVDADGNPLVGDALTTAEAAYKDINDGNKGDSLWYGCIINGKPELKIKVNGGSELTGNLLQAIIADNGIDPASIIQLEVLSRSFTWADAAYMRSSLTALEKLTMSAEIDEFAVQFEHPTLREFNGPRIKSIGNVTFNTNDVFSDCKALTTVRLPAATSITGSFYNCISLTYIELGAIPPTGKYSFGHCPSPRFLSLVDADGNPLAVDALTTAVAAYKDINDGNKGDSLWYGWLINGKPKLLEVKVNGGSTIEPPQASLQEAIEASGVSLDNVMQLEILSGDLLVRDAAYMKSSLTALKKFTLTTAKEFHLKLMSYKSLREIHAPELEIVGSEAFKECSALTTVNLPVATSIGSEAFKECSALTTVNLPVATYIGSDAFSHCRALTTVSLPKATYIGRGAFPHCRSLTTISLPAATYIGDMAFTCSGLTTVSLPAATIIDTWAFSCCSDLIYLELGATPPSVKSAFIDSPSPRYLTLVDADGTPLTGTARQNAFANYKNDSNWDSNTSTWCGWSLMLSIAATAHPSEGGTVSGAGRVVSGAVVTLEATPNEGYRFVRWSANGNELSTEATFSFSATSDSVLVAEFEVITYTLNYTASTGGSISGTSTQTIVHGQNGIEVEAVANEGYKFVRWSDGDTTAKRTDANVMKDLNVQAEFVDKNTNIYILEYAAGDGGKIIGPATQRVADGQSGIEVEAKPNEGYKFVKWSDGRTTAKRTDSNVKANLSVKAEFEKNAATGLYDTQLDALSVYPNPTSGQLWVSVPELAEGTAAEVLVYNAVGQLLQRVAARAASTGSAASRLSIDLSGYPNGLYIIRVGNAVAKVVKQ